MEPLLNTWLSIAYLKTVNTSVMHRYDDPSQVMAALSGDLLAKDKKFFPGKAESFSFLPVRLLWDEKPQHTAERAYLAKRNFALVPHKIYYFPSYRTALTRMGY